MHVSVHVDGEARKWLVVDGGDYQDEVKMEQGTQTEESTQKYHISRLLMKPVQGCRAVWQDACKAYSQDDSRSNWVAVRFAAHDRDNADDLFDSLHTGSRTPAQIVQRLRELRNRQEQLAAENKDMHGKDCNIEKAARISGVLRWYQECLDQVEAILYGDLIAQASVDSTGLS